MLSSRYMNICMEKVVYIDQKGLQYELDNFTVYPRFIRYIHIPRHVSISGSESTFICMHYILFVNKRASTAKSHNLKPNQTPKGGHHLTTT
jgi:hypothetical protein